MRGRGIRKRGGGEKEEMRRRTRRCKEEKRGEGGGRVKAEMTHCAVPYCNMLCCNTAHPNQILPGGYARSYTGCSALRLIVARSSVLSPFLD